MPASLCHSPLHLGAVILSAEWLSSPVPPCVADDACRGNIVGMIRTTIATGNQMLSCALEGTGLALRNAVALCKLIGVGLPHQAAAVVAAAVLTGKGESADGAQLHRGSSGANAPLMNRKSVDRVARIKTVTTPKAWPGARLVLQPASVRGRSLKCIGS